MNRLSNQLIDGYVLFSLQQKYEFHFLNYAVHKVHRLQISQTQTASQHETVSCVVAEAVNSETHILSRCLSVFPSVNLGLCKIFCQQCALAHFNVNVHVRTGTFCETKCTLNDKDNEESKDIHNNNNNNNDTDVGISIPS